MDFDLKNEFNFENEIPILDDLPDFDKVSMDEISFSDEKMIKAISSINEARLLYDSGDRRLAKGYLDAAKEYVIESTYLILAEIEEIEEIEE